MHFSSINGEIREIPAEYKCENLFQLELKGVFYFRRSKCRLRDSSENQAAVFEKWMDENAGRIFDQKMKEIH